MRAARDGPPRAAVLYFSGVPVYLLPLFPLPLVLFPGAPLPLHIFEPRYRQMLSDCMPGSRGAVALLLGCVMEGLFSRTNRATRRTLRANDYRIRGAPGQACCGALHAHAGDLETARSLARTNIAAFERSGAEFIGVNAAGCGAMMKEYRHLLADDADWAERAEKVSARVRDVSELLAAAGPRPGGPLPFRVTYDAPCHLLHARRDIRRVARARVDAPQCPAPVRPVR